MVSSWTQIDFSSPVADEDRVTGLLYSLGIPGWELVKSEREVQTLRIWVLPEDTPGTTAALSQVASAIETSSVLDEHWTLDWQPQRVGPFVITSLGAPQVTVEPQKYRITLIPALAFGGGEHPTTRLCLKALTSMPLKGKRVLDVGCGSGVLAIASSLLGATTVEATDIDPTALRATASAAQASGTPVKVLADGLEGARGPFQLIVSNILAPVLIELAPTLRQLLAPDGQVLLSGIRSGASDDVEKAYLPLKREQLWTEDGWIATRLGPPQSLEVQTTSDRESL